MRHSMYSEEIREQVAEDYKNGMKCTEICEKYNIPHGTLHQIVRSAGGVIRNPKKRQEKCPKCGKISNEPNARFCCWCGAKFLTEKEKIIEKAEKLFPMCAFCPETRRNEMQQYIKDVIAYIKENCKG